MASTSIGSTGSRHPLEIVSIARPRPGPDAALVRVRAVGLCGSWLAVLAGTVTPEPLRRDGPGWAEFLRSQAQEIPALDFFTAAFDAVFQAAGARVVRSAVTGRTAP